MCDALSYTRSGSDLDLIAQAVANDLCSDAGALNFALDLEHRRWRNVRYVSDGPVMDMMDMAEFSRCSLAQASFEVHDVFTSVGALGGAQFVVCRPA